MAIERCAVLGAGLMGAGIAAHLANAGLPVLLLDMPAKEGPRSAPAVAAGERRKKTDPAPLMLPENARLITPGNFDDDLPKLADCDWIIEAVVEDLGAKRALYDRIDAVRKPGSVVSSNTSTIPLRSLSGKQSEAFKRDFCITHFFNPPRYMRLLELVVGPGTRPEVAEELAALCDQRLGKGVVRCKDTPGFIANRIGTHWITVAVNEAIARGITVEEADAAHRPLGLPKTGVFGLVDLGGLDLMPLVAMSLLRGLPPDDDFRRVFQVQPLLSRMIAEGRVGRKAKGGFYRMDKSGGERSLLALDLSTGEYRPATKPRLAAVEAGKRDLRALVRRGLHPALPRRGLGAAMGRYRRRRLRPARVDHLGLALAADKRDDGADLHIVGALGDRDRGDRALVDRLELHGRLVGFDLGEDVPRLDAVAFLDQPFGERPLFHRRGERGHLDLDRHQ